MKRFLRVAPLFLTLAACGGSTVEIGAYSGADSGSPDAATTSPDGGVTPAGPKVHIHLRATGTPVAHGDGLSGQTPSDQRIGIRKLTMSKSAADPSPMVVFDLGANAVEAGLNDKNDTIVASVPAATLKAGQYTLARVAISHVRYKVAATMHASGQNVPGVFSNLQVLSNGSTVDGATFDKGHYKFSFEVGGSALGGQTGESGPLPQTPSGGGITLDTSGTESAYVFPIDIPVDPAVKSDVNIVFELNTHENFRWQDEASPDYQTGVFDVTPTTFEPVKSFGANSFRVFAEL